MSLLEAGAVFELRCDIEAILRVKQLLAACGCDVLGQEFLAEERSFRIEARKA